MWSIRRPTKAFDWSSVVRPTEGCPEPVRACRMPGRYTGPSLPRRRASPAADRSFGLANAITAVAEMLQQGFAGELVRQQR